MPAHYNSSRLPGKLLLDVGGKSLIQHVYDNLKSLDWADIFISASDDKIYDEAIKFTNDVIRVNNTINGTDSVYQAYISKDLDYDIIINYQADNVQFPLESLNHLHYYFRKVHPNGILTTFYRNSLKHDFNRVKLVIAKNRALYFSREPIPHDSDEYKIHTGIYFFWENHLLDIGKNYNIDYFQSQFKGEKLEQLDWLSWGYDIYAIESEPSVSIDSKEDYYEFIRTTENTRF